MAKEEKKKKAEAETEEPAKSASKPETEEAGDTVASSGASASGGASKTSSVSGEAGLGDEKPAETTEKPAEPDWKVLYALTLADFDNYKKRAARDREDVYRYAESDILKDVLPAIDNLQLALANAKDKADDPFVKGVQLVYDTLLKSFKEHGAEPFDSVGKDLDTEKMEAIATLPSDEFEEGKVTIESKRGWMLKDKVLRAAQVVVSSGKPG